MAQQKQERVNETDFKEVRGVAMALEDAQLKSSQLNVKLRREYQLRGKDTVDDWGFITRDPDLSR